jgi:Tol biopolymer transport system component
VLLRGLVIAVLVLLAPACGAGDASESADGCTADLEEAIGSGAEVHSPTWSPDGSRIAFSVLEGEASGIYAIAVGECTVERLGPSGELFVGAPDWSSTDVLAFDATGPGGIDEGIYTMPAGGGPARRVTDGPDLFPEWSPDGTRLAFVRGGYADIIEGDPESEEYSKRNVWVARSDGSDARKVTDGEWHGTAAWTPDGKRLVTDTDPGVIELGADGSGRRVLFESEHDDPGWSPDGKLLLLGGFDGLGVAEEGRPPIEQLGAPSSFSPEWSPDGGWIAFADGEGPHDLWLVRPDGTGLRQLTTTGSS